MGLPFCKHSPFRFVMKEKDMKKLVLSLLAVTVLAGAANLCVAQSDLKPLVTVSFSGYDKLFSNIGMIGKLADNPNLDKTLEMMLKLMTQGKGLAGLDTKQPWGAVLLADGQQSFTGYGFLPVVDLKPLMELAKGNPKLGKIEEKKASTRSRPGPSLCLSRRRAIGP